MIHTTLEELDKRFFDIPFENSQLQTKAFIIQAQLTPARAYRAIGLKMYSKIQAIKELKYSRSLGQVDIDEWQNTVDKNEEQFEVRRCAIKIEQALSMTKYTDKLLNDAIQELNFLQAELSKYPEYTREQFEAEEVEHFEAALQLQIESGNNAAVQSLSYLQATDSYDTMLESTKQRLLND